MAGERTEAATPRRLQELRSQGRVARSVDLATAASLTVGFLVLQQFGGDGVARLRWYMEQRFTTLAQVDLSDGGLAQLAYGAVEVLASVLAPLIVSLAVVGTAANIGQAGLLWSGRAATPDLSRINPLEGARRLFSARAFVELGKTVGKALLLGYLVVKSFIDSVPVLASLGTGDLTGSLPIFAGLALQLGLTAAVALLALGVLDFGYQRWEFQRSARMTREEIKEELRQNEGSPQIRARIRQQQRKLAMRRMMHEVPRADVVVTNPTHYAVALAYRSEEMSAPRVVAKGADRLAERIKEVARQHGVPVVENKPLAQALYRGVEIGMEIPVELFQAVAEVLAYIYALRARTRVTEAERGSGA